MATTSITLKLKVNEVVDEGGTSKIGLVDSNVTGYDHKLRHDAQLYIRVAADEVKGYAKGDLWTFVGTKN